MALRKYPNGTPLYSFDSTKPTNGEPGDSCKFNSGGNVEQCNQQSQGQCQEQCSTANETTADTVSITSFNLLAPLYIRPIDQRTGGVQPFAAFEWISEEDSECILGNETRLPKLLKRMQECGSDFICVQELQLEREEKTFDGTNDENGQQKTKQSSTISNEPKRKMRRSRKEGCNDIDNGIGTDYEPNRETKKVPFVLPKWISPLTQSTSQSTPPPPCENYDVILPPQSELEKMAERNQRVLNADVAVTSAIFYKASKWSPVDNSAQKNDSDVFSNSGNFDNMTSCVMQAFIRSDYTTDPDCVSTENDPKDQTKATDEHSSTSKTISEPIVIVSIHLDARSEMKRVQQLQRCLERAISFSSTPYLPSVIIAGDFNCELFRGSCVEAFLTDGLSGSRNPLDEICTSDNGNIYQQECAKALRLPPDSNPSQEELETWKALYNSVIQFIFDYCWVLTRLDIGCTRVAYNHDEGADEAGDTSEIHSDFEGNDRKVQNNNSTIPRERIMAQWRLDHILFTSYTLSPVGAWSTLEDDEHSTRVGLPNENVPTDHLPIGCLFQRQPHPQLSSDKREELMQQLNEISDRHTSSLQKLQQAMDEDRAALEKQQREKSSAEKVTETQSGSSTSNGTQQPNKKAKKKKAERPSPKMIELIRNSRAKLKTMKSDQLVERQHFFDGRNILERIVLRSFLGDISFSKWIESGQISK